VPYGAGKYTYDLVEGWAKPPPSLVFNNAAGVAIDAEDRIYVFHRGFVTGLKSEGGSTDNAYVLSKGNPPVVIFDRDGNMLDAWGDGVFEKPHFIYVGPDGSVYCTDNYMHTVSKFTPKGSC